MNRIFVVAIGCLVVASAAESAAVAPTPLYGKSVVISWSETRQRREVGQSNILLVERNEHLSIYVSTAGRVFSRVSMAARVLGGRGWTVASEEVAGDKGVKRVPSFSGRSMTFFNLLHSGGIRRIMVDFDAGFGNCNARVGYAKESGHATFTVTDVNGQRVFEIQAVNVGAAVCSVQNGNVLSSQ